MRIYERGHLFWVSYPQGARTVRRSTGKRTLREARLHAKATVPAPSQVVRRAPLPPKVWLHSPATIYVLEAVGTDRVTIGHVRRDSDLARRVADLQGGCPFPLRVRETFPACRREERRLQVALAAHRIRSVAWLQLTDEVRTALAAAAAGDRKCPEGLSCPTGKGV